MQLLPTLVAAALLVTAIPASLGENIKIVPGSPTYKNAYVGVKDKSGVKVPFVHSNDKSDNNKWIRTENPRNKVYSQIKHKAENKCLSYNMESLSMDTCDEKSVFQAWKFYTKEGDNSYKNRYKIIPKFFDKKYEKNEVCLQVSGEDIKVEECDYSLPEQYFIVYPL
ncbi:hypothetical protein BDF19DRAFT_450896 [Syncephalis fuscata]|nr:hypothetical protein BDF19DRAFT_450896 [Syncephalis fuscata]